MRRTIPAISLCVVALCSLGASALLASPLSGGFPPVTGDGVAPAARANHPICNLQFRKSDVAGQQREVERAEQELVQWLEECRGGDKTEIPGEQIFADVIEALLSLPSSFAEQAVREASGADNQMVKKLLGKGKSQNNPQGEKQRSDRATQVLDLMEAFHEPTGLLYDVTIESHAADALQCLSYLAQSKAAEDGAEEEAESKRSQHYQQALKSAKSALQLLDRSEDLYRETGRSPSRLPSIASYVTAIDVWKALAVGAGEVGDEKRRDQSLEVVRALRHRRVEVYTPVGDGGNVGGGWGEYNVLPPEVSQMAVEDVLNIAVEQLRDSVPSYQLLTGDSAGVGTFHFNQLIFDLAKYPQPFSGPLAQDLLEYMVYEVKQSASLQQRRRKPAQSLNVPKPNVETINAVLKAWLVTPDDQDVARRAEAVLAKLAIWQSEGTLWGVSADTVSYNTAIACWKESGIPGAAQRATDILALMEDESTLVTPDVISYASTIGAWADSRDSSAADRAEEILMRMYQRSKDAGGDESIAPRPSTRCFNAALLAYANGRQRGGGKRSMELLRFMESLNAEGCDVSMDSYTFNIVLKALAKCGEKGASRKAHQLLQRMEDALNKGDTSLKPELLSYNTVLDAFSMEGDARSAESLLNQMAKRGDVKPDAHSYSAVITAWSRSEDKANGARRAEELFDDIEGRYAAGETDFRASAEVYNALINCWAKSGERKALYRVTQLLSLMEELGLQGGDRDVTPNSRTYCAVLDTLSRSRNWNACNKSLEILERMENYFSEGYDSVRPCARAYSIVLSTIARSRKKNKAVMAQDLLHRMESEYRSGNSACRPNIYSYNAVLNAAAFSGRDEKEQEDAFKVACLTFDELRMSEHVKPSSVSYGTFLKAIKKLMPESDVRDDLVKGLFRKCSQEGLVSDFVLKEMADLSTPDLYQSLLKGVTNSYGNLPKSWSANVRERDSIMA
ncbi:hypothetical protein ACHAXT_006177 [Thalassiosira profunda]